MESAAESKNLFLSRRYSSLSIFSMAAAEVLMPNPVSSTAFLIFNKEIISGSKVTAALLRARLTSAELMPLNCRSLFWTLSTQDAQCKPVILKIIFL